jgi:quinoprotein glucose dehydrogenase
MRRIPWHEAITLVVLVGGVSIFASGTKKTVKATNSAASYTTWREYGGSPDDAQYSGLKQINRSNVNQLKQVWFYPAGNNGFRYGSNPIVIDGVIYVIGENNSVAALDAATGRQIWLHPTAKGFDFSHRGLMYWENKDRSDRRVLYIANNSLWAIDARTGESIDSFGDHGSVDLRVGLGRDPKAIRVIGNGTPGRVFDDLVILGSETGEEYESPPGDIRAYNVITGKMAWIFHTVPHPGEYGYDTWPPDAWKYIGGTNDWGEMSVDAKRGIVYIPLGSPTYDFYGADRNGADLFSDCVLALDARTGKYLWHYQTTHHDLWDYDLEVGPKLLTVNHDGKKVDILAEAGKNGFLYVLNRVTGKPIWPIVETPEPKSDMPGQVAWPTQPIPTVVPPFGRQKFTADDVDPYIADPKEREAIRKQVAEARNQGIYTPVDTTPTIEMPGNNGGANWGSAAIDPARGLFFVLSKAAPSLIQLAPKPPRRTMTGPPENQGEALYIQNCEICHKADMKGQPPAIPSLVNMKDDQVAKLVKAAVSGTMAPMPAVPDLSSSDVDDVIAYIRHPEKAKLTPQILSFLRAPPAISPKLAPAGTRYWTGYGYMNSEDGLPAIDPPWSRLTAYDLNTGKIIWQIPFGGVDRFEEKGITDTGSYWPRGGVVVTAGGLIFGGSKSDETLRAYDEMTGKVVWHVKMPVGPEGIPAVYEVGGREYVVISARPDSDKLVSGGGFAPLEQVGGIGSQGPLKAQGYYAFALPETSKKK